MMKFLFACLAIACTLLGFGTFYLIIWGIAILCEMFFSLFPMVGVILACAVFFGWLVLIIWICGKVIWILSKGTYEMLCENYSKE